MGRFDGIQVGKAPTFKPTLVFVLSKGTQTRTMVATGHTMISDDLERLSSAGWTVQTYTADFLAHTTADVRDFINQTLDPDKEK